ncbi:MAG TPA: hypothetical protein VMV71_00780 [Candidatus Paceibacterota bacterium]|nr:hypothetical protein [Candidatus Paceibacterota bacterium]
MHIPAWSIVTLSTEILVTASVYFIIWKAYRTGILMRYFAIAVISYEALFNVSYMLSRELGEQGAAAYNPYETALAIFHGTFSLIMFVSLVIFFLAAIRSYARGVNYFLLHRRLTIAFAIAWGVSILSGITLFASLYIFN